MVVRAKSRAMTSTASICSHTSSASSITAGWCIYVRVYFILIHKFKVRIFLTCECRIQVDLVKDKR